MAISREVLESELLNLPASQRSLLLDRLIASLDRDEHWETAWAQETDQREEAIASKKDRWISGHEVIAALREQLS